jgi:hypothetical protein
MPTPPNHQKLVITGKGKKDTISGTDARTIEQWANEGIVRKLIAGPGITLDPATGVDTGTGIEISSSGGGSGSSWSIATAHAGPDSLAVPPGSYIPSNFSGTGFEPFATGAQPFPIVSIPTLGVTQYTQQSWGQSWYCLTNPGTTITTFPGLGVDGWTPNPGTDLTITALIMAADSQWLNAYVIQSIQQTISPSGGTYIFTETDFTSGMTINNYGTDLSLTSVGLVSAGGGLYYGQSQLFIQVPANITFDELA